MILEQNKTTAPLSSAPTDEGQPLLETCNNSIADAGGESKQARSLPVRNGDVLHTVTMTELYDTVYQSPAPVVENLLYSGTYLFVGAPKVGKSFFMAQLAYHVSKGLALWDYPVHQGDVLYLALEDDYARLQKRLARMFGTEENDRLHFAIQSKQLHNGLEEQIEVYIKEHPGLRLIIFDTLQKIRELGGDKFSYANDYEIITALKRISDQYQICMLVVHHTRKQGAEDCFDTISGTNGLLGAADGAFVLQKDKRTENKALLDVAGRDQQDQRLHLSFNHERCVWELERTETELWKEPPDPILMAVANLLTTNRKEWTGTASELSSLLVNVDIPPNALTRRLNVGASRLLSEHSILYENSWNHAGRQVKITLMEKKA